MSVAIDFRAVFESAPGLYLVLDTDLCIVAVTDAYAAATMTERQHILGKNIFKAFPDNPDDPTAEGARNLRASLERVLRDQVTDAMPVQRYDVRRPDGAFEQRFWSPTNSPVLGTDGELRYVIHRVEDVTDFIRLQASDAAKQQETAALRASRQEMEQEVFARAREVAETSRQLKEANAELAQLYARAKELDELKSQFVANISHELRTPLMLILGPTQKLLDRCAPADRDELELILRNARTLRRQIDDLLDASKLETGAVRPDYAWIDVTEQVRLGSAFFESMAVDRGIRLAVDAPQPVPAALDPEHLQRILLNLLSNAFKFVTEGGVIRCTVRPAEDDVVIEIADSGPGIPASHRTAVFERFRQVDGGATRSVGGTGLGLSIVHDLVRLHRGDITITDAPEGGAMIVIELPRAAPPGTPVRRSASEPTIRASNAADSVIAELTPEGGDRTTIADIGSGESEPRPSVIVVEDNADLNALIREALAESYRVITADNGGMGLRLARAHRPDLILCDIMMPGMSGDELLREIRADHELRNTPVLIVSARADEQSRLALLRAGANDYLRKPFEVAELQARVDHLVNLRLAETRLRALRIINERERIAHELHRTVIDQLFGIGMRLTGVRPLARVPSVAARIDGAVHELDDVIHHIRNTVTGLASEVENETPFRTQLMEVTSEAAEALDAQSQVCFEGPVNDLDPVLASAALEAVERVLGTVRQRSVAEDIRVNVVLDDRELAIVIHEIVRTPADLTVSKHAPELSETLVGYGATLTVTTPAPTETAWYLTVPRTEQMLTE
ncbi:ATP-binding protein [Nocardia anaemiae]|uniref:ATP-binding protein n=1 Tax=Nocardia anaemiae TaxID=263910 RepID=UPI0007A386EE|nr:ATP-binding protein [Nocardia anaemiae]